MSNLVRALHSLPPLIALLAFAALGGCGSEPLAGAGGDGLVILHDETLPIGPVGEVEPRPYFHDFGGVMRGERVSHVYRLQNTDGVPIAIKRIVPGCGCTVPSIRYVGDDGEIVHGEPVSSEAETLITIPPGVVAELELSVDTMQIKQTNNDKLMTVTITTDSPNSYYLTLEAHILVERPFNVVPENVKVGRIPLSAGGSGSVTIVQAGSFQWRVSGIGELPEGVWAELEGEVQLGLPVWTLTAGFHPPLTPGRHTAMIELHTETEDGEPAKSFSVPVLCDAVEDIQADPARIVFPTGRNEELQGQATVFSLLSGHRLRITDVSVETEHEELLAATVEPVEATSDGASDRWTVVLKTLPPLPATDVLRGEVRLTSDDPQHPEIRVPYVIHVRG